MVEIVVLFIAAIGRAYEQKEIPKISLVAFVDLVWSVKNS